MELNEALKKIENLIPSIKEYEQTGELPASLDIKKRLLLKEVWEKHYQVGSSPLCITCPGVIKSALSVIHAYYARESVKSTPKKPIENKTANTKKKPQRKRGFLK